MKRVICLVLCLIALVNVLAVGAGAAAVDDYTQWKQYDPAWNQTEAWPAAQYPNASLHTMREAGCLVTSIAMLLRHHNVVMEDGSSFNPGICCDKMKEAGVFNNAADIVFERVAWAYPGFAFAGIKSYSFSKLKELFEDGYACILQVNGSNGYYHYVAVQNIVGSDVYLMNPGAANSTLAELGAAYQIIVYAATPAEYSGRCTYYPSSCKIRTVGKKTCAMTQPCSSGTDSSSVYVRTIPAKTTLRTYGMYMNTAGNLWYKVLDPESGELVYIPSSHTEFLEEITPEVKIEGVAAPDKLDPGRCFSLGGTVTSDGGNLKKVSAYVYNGSNKSGSAVTGASVDVSGRSYDLYNSVIDYATKFNELPEGRYTYVVRAVVEGTYYAESEKVPAKTDDREITLHDNRFTVGDPEEVEAEAEAPETTPAKQPEQKPATKSPIKKLEKLLKRFF